MYFANDQIRHIGARVSSDHQTVGVMPPPEAVAVIVLESQLGQVLVKAEV